MSLNPEKKKSLAFRFVTDTVLVLRENRETPRDEDWDAFLEVLAKNRENFPKLRILVMTDGGGPNVDQRKRLKVALGGRPVRVSVVTERIAVRFIVSSIALLNRDIATFSPEEMSEAYVHLRLNTSEQAAAERAVRQMDDLIELGGPKS